MVTAAVNFFPKSKKNDQRSIERSSSRPNRNSEPLIQFIWFFSIGIFLVWHRQFPYLYGDEYGVLGAAARLAGLDWVAPSGMPFYGFGLSLLIAPLYKLHLDPSALYRLALSINVLLVASSAMLAAATLRRCAPRLSATTRIIVVAAAFGYPSVLFYAGLAMGETALLFSYSLAAYALVRLVDQRKNDYLMAILLGLALGLAPYTHSRGLVFCLAVIPVVWFAIRRHWMQWKAIAMATITAILMVLILSAIKSWLIQDFYTQVREGTGSGIDFLASRVDLINVEQVLVVGQVAFCQMTYLVTSTFGLALLGLLSAIAGSFSLYRADAANEEIATWQKQRAVATAFVVLIAVLMYAVSVLQMGRPSRADHFFYGRYNEVFVPALLVCALSMFFGFDFPSRRKTVIWFSGALASGIIFVLLAEFLPPDIFEKNMIWNPISGWFVLITGPWKIQPVLFAIGTAAGGAVLLFSLLLSRQIFMITLAAMFMAATWQNYSVQHKGGDDAWSWYSTLSDRYERSLIGKKIIVDGQKTLISRLNPEALQFALPNTYILYDKNDLADADFIYYAGQTKCNAGFFVELIRDNTLCAATQKLAYDLKNHLSQLSSDARSSKITGTVKITPAGTIEAGGLAQRLCALASGFFYTQWAEFCLPQINIRIIASATDEDKKLNLGLFISDNAGAWVSEMRFPIYWDIISREKFLDVHIPVKFNYRTPPGRYTVTAALVDSKSWHWQTKSQVELIMK